MSKNERNFWLDGIMSLVFLITIVSGLVLWLVIPNSHSSALAGIDRIVWLGLHIGSGLIGLAGVIIHIVWHWQWLKALRGRSLKTMKKPVMVNRVIDRLTWFAFLSANLFGILAWLLSASLPTGAIEVFERVHAATSMTWLISLAAHLVFHKKWISSAFFRYQPFHQGKL